MRLLLKFSTVAEGDLRFSSTKADSEHNIFFKDGKFKDIEFLIYENEKNSNYNRDPVTTLLKREESPNESWIIMQKDDSTSLRTMNLAPYETLDKEIVDLFLKVKETVNAYERKMSQCSHIIGFYKTPRSTLSDYRLFFSEVESNRQWSTDPVYDMIDRDDLPNEDWVIRQDEDEETIGLLSDQNDIGYDITVLFRLLKEYVAKEYPQLRVRIIYLGEENEEKEN